MSEMSADIECLPGIAWSVQAALHDALKRCPTDGKLLITWMDDKGAISRSAANLSRQEAVWLCQHHILDAYK